MSIITRILLIYFSLFMSHTVCYASNVELKGLGRFDGWRDNPLVGYGIVVGLSGSGDSRQSQMTQQSLQNVLNRMGLTVNEADIRSRNSAAVMITSTLPPSANIGERLNVTISSIGDARSLAGGVLLMTPLKGPDGKDYALAQGPLITGGYSFETEGNFQQRNFPTTARIEKGATVERPVNARLLNKASELSFLLYDPDFSTAEKVANVINQRFGKNFAWAVNADEIRIRFLGQSYQLTRFISDLEKLKVQPNSYPRIVINERTGTVVSGGNVQISPVVISQGGVRITVKAQNQASQPGYISGINPNISSLVVRNTELKIDESGDVVAIFGDSNIADLVQGLNEARVDTREIIGILQAMREAGVLHAQIIVQ